MIRKTNLSLIVFHCFLVLIKTENTENSWYFINRVLWHKSKLFFVTSEITNITELQLNVFHYENFNASSITNRSITNRVYVARKANKLV